MLYRGTVVMACALAMAIAGCGSGNFEAAKQTNEELLASVEQIAMALESVNSPEDVNAAAARIDQATNAIKATIAKAKGLKITQAENDKLVEMQQGKMVELQTRMASAAAKANANSGGNPALSEAIVRFQTAMQTAAQQQ
jgi:aminopeptidase N